MIITPNLITMNPRGTEKCSELFSKLFNERVVFLFHEINDDLAASIIGQMLALEQADPSKDIFLYINSPGGSVSAGMAIYDVMRRLRCHVSTVSCGMSASMGAFLLAGGTKGKRIAYENSDIMLHQVLGGASGQAADVEIAEKNLLRIRTKVNGMLSDFTGMSVKKIEQICDRDCWLTAKEAKKLGIVDEVI